MEDEILQTEYDADSWGSYRPWRTSKKEKQKDLGGRKLAN